MEKQITRRNFLKASSFIAGNFLMTACGAKSPLEKATPTPNIPERTQNSVRQLERLVSSPTPNIPEHTLVAPDEVYALYGYKDQNEYKAAGQPWHFKNPETGKPLTLDDLPRFWIRDPNNSNFKGDLTKDDFVIRRYGGMVIDHLEIKLPDGTPTSLMTNHWGIPHRILSSRSITNNIEILVHDDSHTDWREKSLFRQHTDSDNLLTYAKDEVDNGNWVPWYMLNKMSDTGTIVFRTSFPDENHVSEGKAILKLCQNKKGQYYVTLENPDSGDAIIKNTNVIIVKGNPELKYVWKEYGLSTAVPTEMSVDADHLNRGFRNQFANPAAVASPFPPASEITQYAINDNEFFRSNKVPLKHMYLCLSPGWTLNYTPEPDQEKLSLETNHAPEARNSILAYLSGFS